MSLPSRRVRVLYLDEQDVVDAFASTWDPPAGIVRIVRCKTIPPGAKVVQVTHEFHHKAFAVMIEHESFSEVPEGEQVPSFDDTGTVSVEEFEVRPIQRERPVTLGTSEPPLNVNDAFLETSDADAERRRRKR